MKTLLLLASALALSSLAAHAGNMFSPAAFRNGSPLVTGVDGTYQATARAENVTGIFRFAYSGGSQTSNHLQNSWIFFINGRVTLGSVVANVNESKIDGILDRESSTAFATSTGGNSTSISLPFVQLSDTSDSSSGTFSGKLNLKSPNGAFNGDGVIMPTAQREGSVLVVGEQQVPILDNAGVPIQNIDGNVQTQNIITSTNVAWTNSASLIPNINFKFRGVRTSITAQSATSNSTTSN